jgi:glutathione S-transferase
MIKIHHSRRTRSARVIWLLEELGVPYVLEPVEFKPDVLRSPEHLALHPLGQLPVVEIDGIRMIESGAIVEFLLERYGGGRLEPPRGAPERAPYLQWFHFGEASLAVHVTYIVRNRFGKPEAERLPAVVEEARGHVGRGLAVVERALEGREHVAGDAFTAADIMVAYGIVMAKIIGELPKDLPNVAAYLARLKDRPAYGAAWA